MKYYANKKSLLNVINDQMRKALLLAYGNESMMGLIVTQADRMASLYISTVNSLDQVMNLEESSYLASAYKILHRVERLRKLLQDNEGRIMSADAGMVNAMYASFRKIFDEEITPGVDAMTIHGQLHDEMRNRFFSADMHDLLDNVAYMPAVLVGIPSYADARSVIEEEIKK